MAYLALQRRSRRNMAFESTLRRFNAYDLADVDDTATALVIDPYLGIQTHKMYERFVPPRTSFMAFKDIVDGFIINQKFQEAYDYLMISSGANPVKGLREQIYLYLGVFAKEAGFKVERGHHYLIEKKREVKVIATQGWKIGEKITNLRGTMVPLTRREEEDFVRAIKDFVLLASETQAGSRLWLGPAAFVNHDCSPNCKFVSSRFDLIEVRVIRDINPGDEITCFYDVQFVDEECSCECSSCEAGRQQLNLPQYGFNLRETKERIARNGAKK